MSARRSSAPPRPVPSRPAAAGAMSESAAGRLAGLPPVQSGVPAPAAKQPRTTPLRHATLSQTIYDEVRRRLQSGQLQAGQGASNTSGKLRLLDYEIAREYGCTRTPVRQALLRLVSEGYLQGTTRGFVLPTFTLADIREIFEIRRLLEPHAAASVVPLLAHDQLAQLQHAHAQAAQAVQRHDAALLTQANVAFRSVWLNGLRNQRLLATISRFADHAQLIRAATLSDPAAQGIVLAGLARLCQGFQARDEQGVHEAMKDFVWQAEQHYMRLARYGNGSGN